MITKANIANPSAAWNAGSGGSGSSSGRIKSHAPTGIKEIKSTEGNGRGERLSACWAIWV